MLGFYVVLPFPVIKTGNHDRLHMGRIFLRWLSNPVGTESNHGTTPPRATYA